MHCSPTVDSCCCFSLKTGTKFIAVASLVVSLVMICVYVSLVVYTANAIEENEENTTINPEVSPTSPNGPATTTSTQATTSTTQATTTSTLTTTTTTHTTTITTTATTSTTKATTTTTKATSTTTKATSITTKATLTTTPIQSDVDGKVSSKVKRSVSTDGSESSSVSTEVPDEEVILLMVYTVAVVMYVVEMVASSLLIAGIKKENASLMNMWLIWEGILLVFIVEELVRTSYQHETEGVAHFVQVAVRAYFWIVVMSYRLTVVQARGYQLNGGRKDSYQELQNMESSSESSRG